MSGRPPVDVVVPFAGDEHAARQVVAALAMIDLVAGDTVRVIDNSFSPVHSAVWRPPIEAIRRAGEHSSYYARNEGAALGDNAWILFLDADCQPAQDLIARYFDCEIPEQVGALTGDVLASVTRGESLVAEYCRVKAHLDADHAFTSAPFPFGATANLLVRRAAWSDVGGFCQGIRSGGDVEFCWRIQKQGWQLLRARGAIVRHRHRDSARSLAAQWHRMGAGWAWLRRHGVDVGVGPEPIRHLLRILRSAVGSLRAGDPRTIPFTALDVLCHVESRVGYLGHNRPLHTDALQQDEPTEAVLVRTWWPPADRVARREATTAAIEVEAERRAESLSLEQFARQVHLAEDDGYWERVRAMAWLSRRLGTTMPSALAEFRTRVPALAPTVRRLERLPAETAVTFSPELWPQEVRRLWARVAGGHAVGVETGGRAAARNPVGVLRRTRTAKISPAGARHN